MDNSAAYDVYADRDRALKALSAAQEDNHKARMALASIAGLTKSALENGVTEAYARRVLQLVDEVRDWEP